MQNLKRLNRGPNDGESGEWRKVSRRQEEEEESEMKMSTRGQRNLCDVLILSSSFRMNTLRHYTTVQVTPTHPVNQHFKCTNGGNIDELLCKDESSSELVRVLNTTSEKWISIHGMSLFEGARVVEDASRSHDWLLTYLVASCPCPCPSLSVTSFIPEDISGKRRK